MNNLRQRKINGGNDEFFTKPQIAEYVVKTFFEKIGKVDKNTIFVEPSVGNGSFIKPMKKYTTKEIVAFDINPKTKARQRDFLEIDFEKENIKNAIFIGNPPFGFASSLAIKFFNKASEVATHIVFILPKTFRKESIQKKLNLNFHVVYEEDLPKRSFLVDNKEHDVPSIFQIWVKRGVKRVYEDLENTFIEYTTPDKAEFAIRRVGGNTGKVFIDKDYSKYSIQSNYFCRALRNDVIDKLKETDFSHIINNTAGVRSLSKNEILNVLHKKI
ncbi:MAG: hypothetical protein OXU73_01230 [Candidatus Campbellbacteria bacterium]|nr:hypothetical protein [Candidatus Campbellbacteria bacterium]